MAENVKTNVELAGCEGILDFTAERINARLSLIQGPCCSCVYVIRRIVNPQ